MTEKLSLRHVADHIRLIGRGKTSPYTSMEMLQVLAQHDRALKELHGIVDNDHMWDSWEKELTQVYDTAGVRI